MPAIEAMNDAYEKLVLRYVPPVAPGMLNHSQVGIAALKERRRAYANAEQELLVAQKDLGRAGNRDAARMLKDEVRHFQRMQKAVTLWLGWLEEGGGFGNWPIELASELDAEFHAYELAA